MEKKNSSNHIDRREFLRRFHTAMAVVGAPALVGCQSEKQANTSTEVSDSKPKKEGGMTYRTTPTTGDKVSLLGYGCMRWFTLRDKETGIIDQEAVNRLVDYAIEHGVNYFDTAPVYCDGECERVTGIALNRHPRDKFYIAAKISNLEPETWSREETLKMYNNSFKELQMDYIDYLLLHGVGMGGMEEIEGRFLNNGVLDHLLEERKKGRIRNLGFSFHGDVKIFDYLLSLHDAGKYTWDFVQIQLNYVDWRHAQEEHARNINAEYLYGELAKRNIPSVIMEPLLGGRLANVHAHIASILKQRRPDLSIASWAFRFVGTHPMVLSVLSGMPYMEHLKENIETYSPLEPLTQDDMDFLDSTAQKFVRYPLIPCNDCKYCMPCPYGIDIPGILLHFNKCINEDRMPVSSMEPTYRELRRAFLIGYDRSVPKLRQADHCTNCGICVKKCPQRINIPKQMNRIDRFVEALKQGKEFDDKTNYLWSR
jgi:predicted aldo/keto reductase-like oxidoreductase